MWEACENATCSSAFKHALCIVGHLCITLKVYKVFVAKAHDLVKVFGTISHRRHRGGLFCSGLISVFFLTVQVSLSSEFWDKLLWEPLDYMVHNPLKTPPTVFIQVGKTSSIFFFPLCRFKCFPSCLTVSWYRETLIPFIKALKFWLFDYFSSFTKAVFLSYFLLTMDGFTPSADLLGNDLSDLRYTLVLSVNLSVFPAPCPRRWSMDSLISPVLWPLTPNCNLWPLGQSQEPSKCILS